MNDGVGVCINVLRSVAEHLDAVKPRLSDGPAKEAVARLRPYAEALGDHFSNMNGDERKGFRGLRGNQGQAAGTRHAQKALQDRFPSFQAPGLSEFLELERERTNDRAMTLVNRIDRLSKPNCGFNSEGQPQHRHSPDAWWYEAVPLSIRTVVTQSQEDDKNWTRLQRGLLQPDPLPRHHREQMAAPRPRLREGQEDRSQIRPTAWLVRTNEIRKIAAHGSSGATVSLEQLNELQDYHDWLHARATEEAEEVGQDEDPDADGDAPYT